MRWRVAFGLAVVVQLVALYNPSDSGGPGTFPGADKVVHLLLFAAVAWTGTKAGLPRRPLAGVLLLNAVVSELVQWRLLSQRSGDAYDLLADVAGVVVGLWVARAT